jgi:hypothetical protein
MRVSTTGIPRPPASAITLSRVMPGSAEAPSGGADKPPVERRRRGLGRLSLPTQAGLPRRGTAGSLGTLARRASHVNRPPSGPLPLPSRLIVPYFRDGRLSGAILAGRWRQAEPLDARPMVFSTNPVLRPLRPVFTQIARFRSLSEIAIFRARGHHYLWSVRPKSTTHRHEMSYSDRLSG